MMVGIKRPPDGIAGPVVSGPADAAPVAKPNAAPLERPQGDRVDQSVPSGQRAEVAGALPADATSEPGSVSAVTALATDPMLPFGEGSSVEPLALGKRALTLDSSIRRPSEEEFRRVTRDLGAELASGTLSPEHAEETRRLLQALGVGR
jgi:hypothetical protein